MAQNLGNESEHESHGSVTLTVVIPVFNEEDVLGPLFERSKAVFCRESFSKSNTGEVSYIVVDGSTHRSPNMIASYIAEVEWERAPVRTLLVS